ncbi:MAG TPA: MBL fold metallo-hydrolase [Vicinamibacterales bacterium]|nr:MBL fold metallo-hydrolase [Vicinamibacterales bacterium]
MSHAHFRSLGLRLAILAGLAAFAAPALAQQPPQNLTVHQLKSNVYWAEGAGGNSGIIIGNNGVVIVDAKVSADGGKMLLAEVAKLTNKPVTHAILTHSDGDHINGLAAFPSGVKVIAHEGNKMEQEAAAKAGGRGAPPPQAMPTIVVTKNSETMTLDGVKFELHHWAPAHTSGDLIVYLPAEGIVFTGDIVATQREDPIIHTEKHGSSEGWITTMQGIDNLKADTFVPGHGDVQTRAQIEARLKRVSDKRAQIAAMIKQGKSLDEIKAAVGDTPPAPAAGGGRGRGGPQFASLSDVVYGELKGK